MYINKKQNIFALFLITLLASNFTYTMDQSAWNWNAVKSVWSEVKNGWFGWVNRPNNADNESVFYTDLSWLFNDDNAQNPGNFANSLAPDNDLMNRSEEESIDDEEVINNQPNQNQNQNNDRRLIMPSVISNIVPNIRNAASSFFLSANNAAREKIDQYVQALKNDRKTQAITATGAAVVIGATVYFAHKVYTKAKLSKTIKLNNDAIIEIKKELDNFVNTLDETQCSKCPEIYTVITLIIKGTVDPNLFMGNAKIYNVLNDEQKKQIIELCEKHNNLAK